jgi:predicted RNase H-like HicB family nuclease
MKTYLFKVELEKEDDVWTAVVPALPGCNAWANTKDEALAAIQENIQAYVGTLVEDGLPIPVESETVKIP